MPQYTLRDLPPDLWSRFTSHATLEKWPLRALFIQMMDDFANGRRPQGAPPEQMPIYAWVRPYYQYLTKFHPGFRRLSYQAQWQVLISHLRHERPNAGEGGLELLELSRRTQVLTWLDETTPTELPVSLKLTLRAIAHAAKGPDMMKDRRPIQYEVLGLPPGQQAWIANLNHVWKILRVINGEQGDWDGTFASADEALQELEQQVIASDL
jgi:hypothetical protein